MGEYICDNKDFDHKLGTCDRCELVMKPELNTHPKLCGVESKTKDPYEEVFEEFDESFKESSFWDDAHNNPNSIVHYIKLHIRTHFIPRVEKDKWIQEGYYRGRLKCLEQHGLVFRESVVELLEGMKCKLEPHSMIHVQNPICGSEEIEAHNQALSQAIEKIKDL